MSEQTRPQPPREIDRADVLGELEHRWGDIQGDLKPNLGWVLDQLTELDILRYRTPPLCGASEGMTGIDCQLPKGHVMPDGSLRIVHEGTTTAEQTEYVGYETFIRWPVDGKTLPVSPAAEAEKPERDADEGSRLPIPVRQRVGQLLLNGDVIPAARTVQETLRLGSLQDGVNFVHGLDEYRTYLNHRQVEDVSLPPLHADNEAIVRGQYPQQREPRVFRSDGPEPPEGVDRLEASRDVQGWTHIVRDGSKWWRWCNEHGQAMGSQEWFRLPSWIEFREVV